MMYDEGDRSARTRFKSRPSDHSVVLSVDLAAKGNYGRTTSTPDNPALARTMAADKIKLFFQRLDTDQLDKFKTTLECNGDIDELKSSNSPSAELFADLCNAVDKHKKSISKIEKGPDLIALAKGYTQPTLQQPSGNGRVL